MRYIKLVVIYIILGNLVCSCRSNELKVLCQRLAAAWIASMIWSRYVKDLLDALLVCVCVCVCKAANRILIRAGVQMITDFARSPEVCSFVMGHVQRLVEFSGLFRFRMIQAPTWLPLVLFWETLCTCLSWVRREVAVFFRYCSKFCLTGEDLLKRDVL